MSADATQDRAAIYGYGRKRGKWHGLVGDGLRCNLPVKLDVVSNNRPAEDERCLRCFP